jgi:hypothetical protein
MQSWWDRWSVSVLTFLAALVLAMTVANWMQLDAIKASVERVAAGLEQVRSAMVDD